MRSVEGLGEKEISLEIVKESVVGRGIYDFEDSTLIVLFLFMFYKFF